MDKGYGLRLEKIEALLGKKLPAAPDAGWMRNAFPGLGARAELAGGLLAPARELLGRGGKRWRPLLSLLVCEAVGGCDSALPLLPLVEFCHNASLIHDDIEDNSELRRGKPAIHLVFGQDMAINTGCFLYFLPLMCIDEWNVDGEAKVSVQRLWGEHMRRLHFGQSLDIAWHRDFHLLPSLEDYFLMCRLKTGCLARFAVLLGLAAAKAARSVKTADIENDWAEAAEKLGTGFQILDDVKNLTVGIPGKKRGDDIVEGKKSLPVLLYLEAHPEKAAFAADCFKAARKGGVSVPQTEAFIAELEQAGVLAEAETRGKALVGEAQDAFAKTRGLPGDEGAVEGQRLLAGITELLQ